MKRESQFNVVRGAEEEKTRAEEELRDRFEDPELEKFAPYEIETTSIDDEIIHDTMMSVDDIIRSYGAEPSLSPRENIHILKRGGVSEMTDDRFADGYYSILNQSVAVDRSESNTVFATGLAHEFFHLKSSKSAQVDKDGDPMPYRTGISMWDKETGTEYFGEIEEAVVSELVHRFYNESMRENPMYKKEIEDTDRLKEYVGEFFRSLKDDRMLEGRLDNIEKHISLEDLYYIPSAKWLLKELKKYKEKSEQLEFFHGALDSFKESDRIGSIEKRHERKRLDHLLRLITEQPNSKIRDKEELFEVFAHAQLTGRYLPLARIIESSLGKGGFRRVAEVFKRKPYNNEDEAEA